MKLKSLFLSLGIGNRPKRYGYSIVHHQVGREVLKYAQWLHPSESRKVFPQHRLEQLASFLKKGDFCVDIGAHSGDTALLYGLACGPEGLVLAYEPNPFIFPVLQQNALLNRGVTNIVPVLAAATSEDGEIVFEYSDAGFCNGGFHEGMSLLKHGHPMKLSVWGVNVTRELQNHFSDRLSKLKFIKIDCEGYDLSVARSLSPVLDAHRPYVLAEIFKKTGRDYRLEFLKYFESKGYRLFYSTEDVLEGERLTPDNLTKWAHFDVFCRPQSAAT